MPKEDIEADVLPGFSRSSREAPVTTYTTRPAPQTRPAPTDTITVSTPGDTGGVPFVLVYPPRFWCVCY